MASTLDPSSWRKQIFASRAKFDIADLSGCFKPLGPILRSKNLLWYCVIVLLDDRKQIVNGLFTNYVDQILAVTDHLPL